MTTGRLEAICITSNAADGMLSVTSAEAIAGEGLATDRYAESRGAFQKGGVIKDDEQITLIEQEAIEGASHEYDLNITHSDTRRNLLTSGIAVNHLVGKDFYVGEVLIRGHRLCEPCGYLEKHTYEGIEKALIHRGGLRAEILEGGTISVGDTIRVKD